LAESDARMSIIFVEGDLFNYPNLDAIAHGCNCAGAMGKGIALEFKNRFPDMYQVYREHCLNGKFGLCDVFVWKKGSIVIFNLGTQQTWRSKATLIAITESVHKIMQLAHNMGLHRIGIPRIGAGLGGLDWDDVKQILTQIANEYDLELVVFQIYKKTAPTKK
jgi:O-acetyl-ADP-ribose deacetylase (regulator of RNase III)